MSKATHMTVALLLLGLLLCVGTPAKAVFEELTISPRARAMGEATVAVEGDAWTFNHNPAALATLERPYAATSTTQPNGTNFNRLSAVGGSTPLPGGRGGLAFGFRHYGVEYKDVDLTREQTISIAHGITLFRDASSSAHVGWGVNFYNVEFAETIGGVDPGGAWAVGMDAGVLVTLHERTRAGFFVRNLNNPTIGEDEEELRQSLAGGISYEPYDGVITAFDIRSQMGEELRFHGGLEVAITRVLALRAGIETDPSKMTAGFGVNLPHVLSFDYGLSTGGGLPDMSHQFGLTVRFGQEVELP